MATTEYAFTNTSDSVYQHGNVDTTFYYDVGNRDNARADDGSYTNWGNTDWILNYPVTFWIHGLSKISGSEVPSNAVISKVEMWCDGQLEKLQSAAGNYAGIWVVRSKSVSGYGVESSGAIGLTGTVLGYVSGTGTGTTNIATWVDITDEVFSGEAEWTKARLETKAWAIKLGGYFVGSLKDDPEYYGQARVDYIKIRVTWRPKAGGFFNLF